MSKVAKLGAMGTVSIECNGPSAASQSPAPTHAGDGLCGTVPVVPDLHDIVCRGLPNARPARLRHLHRLPGLPAYLIKKSGGAGILGPMSRGAVE